MQNVELYLFIKRSTLVRFGYKLINAAPIRVNNWCTQTSVKINYRVNVLVLVLASRSVEHSLRMLDVNKEEKTRKYRKLASKEPGSNIITAETKRNDYESEVFVKSAFNKWEGIGRTFLPN